MDILDEIANPDGCTWTVYQGPLFLDLELGASIDVEELEGDREESDARPLDPSRINIEGVAEMASREAPFLSRLPGPAR